MAKPPFPWIGSKEKIAPYILQLFPPKLTQYVDCLLYTSDAADE